MTADPTTEEAMRAAIAEIRREGYKAAGLHAIVDAVLLALASNLAVSVLGVPWFDRGLGLAGGRVAVTVGTALVVLTGLGVFAVELAVRTRRPIVERFEAANPTVDEALRTARDAIERDEDSRVARALYADVIERLRSTSSLGLVDTRRLVASVVLVFVLSIATIHVSAITLDTAGSGPAPSGSDDGVTGGPDQRTPATTELRSGEEVLGEPEDVTAGSANLSAPVTIEPGGPGDDEFERFDPDEESRGSTGGEVRRAGYAPPDDIENADLIREYNLRIRDDNDE